MVVFPWLIVSAVESLVFLGIVWLIAGRRARTGWLCVWCFAAFLFSCVVGTVPLLLQAFLTLIAVCCAAGAGRKTVFGAAVVSMLAAYGLIGWSVARDLNKIDELRREFPIVSLSDRLAYEKRAALAQTPREAARRAKQGGADLQRLLSKSNAPPKSVPDSALAPEIEKRLSEFEARGHSNHREYLLSSLHERSADSFAGTIGFGWVRTIPLRRERLELPENPPVPMPGLKPPEEPYRPDSKPISRQLLDAALARALPARDNLLGMHDAGLQDFLDRRRFGSASRVDHVIGFSPHQFSEVPKPEETEVRSTWQVNVLELVSLLKFDSPRIYVSKTLPRMDELKDAPTRPLDSFETAALVRLRGNEDLVIDEELDRIRMLGSIRAGRDCLQCHSVERGDLLGAFSYELLKIGDGKPLPSRRDPGTRATPST